MSHSKNKAKSPAQCAEIVFGNLTNLEMLTGRNTVYSSLLDCAQVEEGSIGDKNGSDSIGFR